VALLAGSAELALVQVGVTRRALRTESAEIAGPLVAGSAGQRAVLPFEREPRLSFVIERRSLEPALIVAGGAVLLERAAMRIFVAGSAGPECQRRGSWRPHVTP